VSLDPAPAMRIYPVFPSNKDFGIVHGYSSRTGGQSEAPYDSLNMGDHVGDDPACVGVNRALFSRALGLPDIEWQVKEIRSNHK